MPRTHGIALSLALAFACIGCNPAPPEGERTPPKADAPDAKAEEDEKAPPVEEPTEAPAETGGEPAGETGEAVDPNAGVVIEGIGLPECDRYIETFLRCVNEHAPAGEKERHLAALREQVAAWKQSKAGGGENAARALPIGCKAAEAAAKAASEPWGCGW